MGPSPLTAASSHWTCWPIIQGRPAVGESGARYTGSSIAAAKCAILQGEKDRAQVLLDAAIHQNWITKHRQLCNAAKLYIKLCNLDAAACCVEMIKQSYPDSVHAWQLAGEVWRLRGNFEESISCYKYALKHSRILEDAVSSLNEIANCFVDTSRKDEALEIYRHMLRIAPHAAVGYYGYIASNASLEADDSVKLSIIKLLETRGLSQAKRMNLHYAG